MKEDAYDKLLIKLAQLAPLLLIVLSQWQASLMTWYMPWDDATEYFGDQFAQDVSAIPELKNEVGSTLVFIADEDCPCTRASLSILKSAMRESGRKDLHLIILDVNGAEAKSQTWTRVLAQIPATPTLLITEGETLRYGGPVIAGNLCTTRIQEVLGLSVLQENPTSPVISQLETGCYCSIEKANNVL